MSDDMRKGLGQQVCISTSSMPITLGALLMFVALQASEKMTPDSQKSTLDQAKESVTGAGDRIAGAAQPGEFA